MKLLVFLGSQKDSGISDYVSWLKYIYSDIDSSFSSILTFDHNCIHYLDGSILSLKEIDRILSSDIPFVFTPTEWVKVNSSSSRFKYFYNQFSFFDTFYDFLLCFLSYSPRFLLFLYQSRPFRAFFRILNLFLPGIRYRLELLYRSSFFDLISHRISAIISPDSCLTKHYVEVLPSVSTFTVYPYVCPSIVTSAIDKFIDFPNYSNFFSGRLTRYRGSVLGTLSPFGVSYVRASSPKLYLSSRSEFYIPQSFSWPYTSIMRSYRALSNGCLVCEFSFGFPNVFSPLSPPAFLFYAAKSLPVVRSWRQSSIQYAHQICFDSLQSKSDYLYYITQLS